MQPTKWHIVANETTDPTEFETLGQGPWDLYNRDDKFHATFKSGTEKRWFSVPLLMA